MGGTIFAGDLTLQEEPRCPARWLAVCDAIWLTCASVDADRYGDRGPERGLPVLRRR